MPGQKQADTQQSQEEAKPKAREEKTSKENKKRGSSSSVSLLLWYSYLCGHLLVLFSTLMVLFKQTGFYNKAAYASMFMYGSHLMKVNGRPQLNLHFAQKVMMDENTFSLLYPLISLLLPRSALFLAPMTLRSAALSAGQVCHFTKAKLPKSFLPTVTKVTQPITKRNREIVELSRTIEVYLGCWLVIGIFLRTNSFMQLLIYWQYLRMRYMLIPQTAAAFRVVDRKIRSYLPSSMVPYYEKLNGYLYSMVDPELQRRTTQAGEGISGMFKSCSIM